MGGTDRESVRREWRDRLALWRASGLSAAAFCREHDVPVWRFHYWTKRIAALEETQEGGFARVTPSGSGLRLSLPGGLQLELDPEFDEATLRRFLKVAAGGC